MLSYFRRLVRSRVGVVVTFIFLVLIALAFAAGDVSNMLPDSGVTGNQVAKVGDQAIGEAELQKRVQADLAAARREQPTMDVAQYLAAGGLESSLERMINGIALAEFARENGMRAGKQAIDGAIASQPGLQGPDGQFSQALYERVLRENRISAAELRTDVAGEILTRQLVAPTIGASQVPETLARPYASLLLERRQGLVGFVPASAARPAAPTDAEVAEYYRRNVARYSLPERRIARYVTVTPATLGGQIEPTEEELRTAYAADASKYAATQTRTITQVIVADQAAATRLAQQVKGGTAIAAAARALGLEPSSFTRVSKDELAQQTAPAVADAAFGATKGSIGGPVRSGLGFHVFRVDDVADVPARSFDQMRSELATQVRERKRLEGLSALHDAMDDSFGDGATLEEVASERRLQVQRGAPVTATGRNPGAPDDVGVPQPVAAAVFAAEEGDDPVLVPLGEDGSFAAVALDSRVPAAAIPLAQVRSRVTADLAAERGAAAARKVAERVLAAVNGGTPLRQALASTGLKLPSVETVSSSRAQIVQSGQRVPAALALMFSMAPKRAKLLAAPRNEGWFVVYLDAIQEGDASKNAAAIATMRRELGSYVGREYIEQFVTAARRALGETRNAGALDRVRQDLAGGGTPAR